MSFQLKKASIGSSGNFIEGTMAATTEMPAWCASSRIPTKAIRMRFTGDPYSCALTRMASVRWGLEVGAARREREETREGDTEEREGQGQEGRKAGARRGEGEWSISREARP
eukprot:8957013-Pyramimonas_sp.AAC.1